MNKVDGKALAGRSIDVPKVPSAHATWVEKGPRDFRLQGGSLIVAGRYALSSDRDNPIDFSVSMPVSAFRKGK